MAKAASETFSDSIREEMKTPEKEVLILIRNGYNAIDVFEAESYLKNRGWNGSLSCLVIELHTRRARSYWTRMAAPMLKADKTRDF